MRKVLPVIVLAAVAGVILFLLFGAPKQGQQAEPVTLSLPDKWQEFNRSAVSEGDQAMKLFQTEHVRKLPFNQGIKGEYSDGKNRFTVWVGVAKQADHASVMVADMSKAIGTTHKVFSEPKQVDVGGSKVWVTQGQGFQNYYYAKDRKVYWIGVGGSEPEALLKRIMADF